MYELKFSLTEKRGERTNNLIQEIATVIESYGLEEEVSFSYLVASPSELDENNLVYTFPHPALQQKKQEQLLILLFTFFRKCSTNTLHSPGQNNDSSNIQ